MRLVAGHLTSTRDRHDRFAATDLWIPAVAVTAFQFVVFGVPMGVWFQGAILGMLNARVAMGLALIWRSNRAFDLAQADMGTLPTALGVAFCAFWGWNWFDGLFIGLVAAIGMGKARGPDGPGTEGTGMWAHVNGGHHYLLGSKPPHVGSAKGDN